MAAGKAARKVAPPPIQIAYQAGKGGIQKGPGRHHPEGWQQRTTLRTIRRLERLETPIMHEARFETVLREIAQETQSAEEWNNQRTKIRFQRSAVIAFQHSIEMYLIGILRDAKALAKHARRSTVMPNDVLLAYQVQNGEMLNPDDRSLFDRMEGRERPQRRQLVREQQEQRPRPLSARERLLQRQNAYLAALQLSMGRHDLHLDKTGNIVDEYGNFVQKSVT